MVRWPRPRFRVRTILLIAAVAGLALGLDGMRRRRSFCLERAAYHRRVSDGHGNLRIPLGRRVALASRRRLQYQALREGRDPSIIAWTAPPKPTEAERVASEDEYARLDPHYAWHLGWIRRFEHAANRPWRAVPIEPEEPAELIEGHNWWI